MQNLCDAPVVTQPPALEAARQLEQRRRSGTAPGRLAAAELRGESFEVASVASTHPLLDKPIVELQQIGIDEMLARFRRRQRRQFSPSPFQRKGMSAVLQGNA